MTEKNFLTKTLNDTVISRRSFLKWSAALGGTAALAGGFNYGLKQVAAAAEAAGSEGKWVPVACWHNCGGRCMNVALVKDGVVIRQKTDDTHPDSPDYPQQRGCARGRSQRHQVFGADRIKYPMKRKNWVPGGGKKELRGIDEWVRISWDEALDIVSSELKRIKTDFGNASILLPRTDSKLIAAFGGYTGTYGVTSEGAWPIVRSTMTGGLFDPNDRLDYRNSRLIVLWGSNPARSSGGNPNYNYLQAKKAGAKIIVVTPENNQTAQALADEWIPVRPSTDAALLIGMAHHMITNNLHDQGFLDKYTVGFDSEHMPKGANKKENFKDYVLGTYDGIPKTPEWASEICGTPVDLIRSFATEICSIKPMIFQSSWAIARNYFGQSICQAFFTVGWMTGNVGISGGGVVVSSHSGASYGGSRLVSPGGSGLKGVANPLAAGQAIGYGFANPSNTEFQAIAWEEMWEAILNDEYHATVRGKIPCDIRMLYRVQDGNGGNGLNQVSGTWRGIEAFRKVEFVVSSDIVLSTTAKYSDVVLPTTTPWEQDLGGFQTGNPEMVLWCNQIIEPLYEARDCQWIEKELAKRLDINPDDLYPISRTQQAFNSLVGAKVILPDASGYEPLVTITTEDISNLGVEGESQTGRIPLKELMEKGSYQVPRSPDDKFGYVAGKAFREDPTANPLSTLSGKLEIHCQTLSDTIKDFGFTTTPPIPQYRPPVEGIEETFADWDKKIKGDFPLQIHNPHSFRRSHSVFDNIAQLRKAFPQESWINPIDAKKRGISTGDNMLITSRHGKVLRPAYLTDRVMPGVITLGEGAWVQMDDTLGIDIAGATNSLCGAKLTGQGEEPWNTCIVQVEKWTGKKPDPDYLWPQRIPIEEA